MEHDRVKRAEDRRRAADAERKRENGHCRETGILPELAKREAEILRQLAEVLEEFHLPISPCAKRVKRRPHPAEVAEPVLGGPARRLRIHSACDVLAGAHLEVEGEFFVHLVSNARPPEHTVEKPHEQSRRSVRQQHARDRGGEAAPLGRLCREMPAPLRSEPVELRAPAKL